MDKITNKYSYLFEYPNLKQGEDKEIFTAIKNGIDVEFNKERLFNAFFKRIYKEAAKIIKLGYHDSLEEAINHIVFYFYRGIDTYNSDKGACFYTHIEYWIKCATYKSNVLKKDPRHISIDLDFEFGGDFDGDSYHHDCNGSAKQKKEILDYCENYCSGINVQQNIEKRDFLNQINDYLKNSTSLKEKDKRSFIEFYGLDDVENPMAKTATAISKKQGVCTQAILNRINKVQDELKSHFISEKNFLYG